MSDSGTSLRVLLVDDETSFRESLANRLELRGFQILQAADGEEAVQRVRGDSSIDVVVLDKNMPGLDGAGTLKELKMFRPEIPVILLTAFGSVDSAMRLGRLGVFRYLAKPVRIAELQQVLEEAGREKQHARARLDMPARRHTHWWARFLGSHNLRPAVLLLGAALLLATAIVPLPGGLHALLETPRSAMRENDIMSGYPGYGALEKGQTVADYYRLTYRPPGMKPDNQGEFLGRRALIMAGLILVAALFWATGAMPMGVTALLVAVVMHLAGVMRPDGIAQAFAKDAVVFIFGVLVLSQVIVATGLDRRLARLLLLPVRNLPLLLFLFLPLFAVACSFISESILIALMLPIFLKVHRQLESEVETPQPTSAQADGSLLMVMFALMLCYASNVGGPGSPAAGGRNAVMVGILADYGQAPTFLEWMRYGLPFVPVASLVVGLYFFVVFGPRLRKRRLDVAALARQSHRRLGPMTREERATALVCLLVVILWVFASNSLGMGGPTLLGLVLLNLLGVLKWRQITGIHWDLVFLYAGAGALGKGLAETGGALWLARGFVSAMPADAAGGQEGLAVILPMAVSLLTGLVTNLMSDGATVAALGPIAVPMARDVGLHPWQMGFATAFASSFPHMLVIGTPANALVYILCKDPVTGRQLVTQRDFLKHGSIVFLLSFAVLWGWAFFGYWRWLGFP